MLIEPDRFLRANALVSPATPPQLADVLDSARMLSFDDERWNYLTGGYKTQFDPRPSLRKLENQQDTATAWEGLWEELHHQGNVGDASYAAVPELVRIHRSGGIEQGIAIAGTAFRHVVRLNLY